MSNIDLSEISSELVRSALLETIKTMTKSMDHQIEIISISKIVSSYANGILYRVSFTTKVETNSLTSSLVLKVSPQNSTSRAILFSRLIYLREIFIYDEVCDRILYQEYKISNV